MLYSVDGVQGITDNRHWLAPRYAIGCALGQLRDAIGGKPYLADVR
jgi:hypothetical protein